MASEALTLVRTVITFGTFKPEQNRYAKETLVCSKQSYKLGMILAFSFGMADAVNFLMYSVAFWSVPAEGKRRRGRRRGRKNKAREREKK